MKSRRNEGEMTRCIAKCVHDGSGHYTGDRMLMDLDEAKASDQWVVCRIVEESPSPSGGYQTTHMEASSKSDPDARDALAEKAGPSLRERLEALSYYDGGKGLHGVASDVGEAVGAEPESRGTSELIEFCLAYPDTTREVLE